MTPATFPICFYDAYYFCRLFGIISILDQCLPGMFKPEADRLWYICQRWHMSELHVQAGLADIPVSLQFVRVDADPIIKRLQVGL